MSRVTRTVLIDDFTGEEADETLAFGVDGVLYEIELNKANAEAFRAVVAPYQDKARRVGRVKTLLGAGANGDGMDPAVRQQIREWAEKNGYKTSARGRIPASVMEAWERARS